MTERKGVWQVSEEVKVVNIDGYLIPMHLNDQPWVVTNDGETWFIAVFSTKEKMDSMTHVMNMDMTDFKIKKIVHGAEFLESVRSTSIRVMADPWVNEAGNTRFTEVKLDIPQ